jgi:hypothetical protein
MGPLGQVGLKEKRKKEHSLGFGLKALGQLDPAQRLGSAQRAGSAPGFRPARQLGWLNGPTRPVAPRTGLGLARPDRPA